MKKLVSLILALVLVLSVFSIVPMSASADTIDPDKVYVKVENQYYEVEKGDIFTYIHKTGYADAKISSIDIRINYDSSGLKFIPSLDENGDVDYDSMFPVLGDSVVENLKEDGIILFNYSHTNGKRLTGDNTTMFCGNFEVTADSGVYEIDGYVHVLADVNMNRIVFQGKKILEYEESESLPELTPVETETQTPTEEPTDAPTIEPTEATTEEPTEAPTVEPTEEPTELPTQEPTDPPYDYTTVYLINSANWTNQNIYLWDNDGDIATWPGLAMTYTGKFAANGAAIFKFTYNKYYENVIFNNGVNGVQTDDLQVHNDWYFDNESNQWLESPDDVVIPTEEPTQKPTEDETVPTEIPTDEPTEPTEVETNVPTEPSEVPTEEPTVEPSDVKVYLVDEAGWGGSHVYAWSGEEEHASWPGATMTFEGTDAKGNQIFSFTFAKEYENIIFNLNGTQTDDLEFKAGGFYNNLTNEWENIPGDDTNPTEKPTEDETQDPTDKPTEDPSQDPTTKPSEVFGDVDGDGETKVFDATLIQRYLAKSSELTEEQKLVADVDGDGEIKVFDATMIQRYIAKLE